MTEQAVTVVTILADGQVIIGPGVTVGQALEALELARRAVLAVVLVPVADKV